jgi:hypothetical protein
MNPDLIIRTRMMGDILLCDFCQYYKCDWLDYSPSNFPQYCPEVREFWIAEDSIPRNDFMRRAAVAQTVGIYIPKEHSWRLHVKRTKNLTVAALNNVMNEICTWSPKNKLTLSDMVKYIPSEDSRTTVQKKL